MKPRRISATVYLARDAYGIVKWAGTSKDAAPADIPQSEIKHRTVRNTRELCRAMLQSGTRDALFSAAWRRAVVCGSVGPCLWFMEGDSWDFQVIEYARQDAQSVEAEISDLVNNPRSRFYIYG